MYSILKATANDIGNTGFDNYFGWGLIDAFKAIEALMMQMNLVSEPFVKAEGSDTPAEADVRALSVDSKELPVRDSAEPALSRPMADDTVIIKLKTSQAVTTSAARAVTISLMRTYGFASITGAHQTLRKVSLAKNQNVEDVIEALKEDPLIEYAQPNYLYRRIE